MSTNPQLAALFDVGLISELQIEAALTHDDAAELDEQEDEVDMMFWLLCNGIVSEDELEAEKSRLMALPGASDADEARFYIVNTALEIAAEVIKGTIRPELEPLLALGLIDAGQLDAGCDMRPNRLEGMIDTPARALAVLVNRGIVTEEQFEAMKTQAHANTPGEGERAAVVIEAEKIYNEMVDKVGKAISSGIWRMVLILILVLAGVMGLTFWLT